MIRPACTFTPKLLIVFIKISELSPLQLSAILESHLPLRRANRVMTRCFQRSAYNRLKTGAIMGRLVVIGDGPTAEIFLHQLLRAPREFPITVFGGSFLTENPDLYEPPPTQTEMSKDDLLEVRHGVTVAEVDRHALVVIGADGSRTSYERLVVATGRGGLRPAGLQLRNGRLLVNQNFETSDGHIYAIGECAEAADPRDRISLVWQARTLAAMLLAHVPQEHPRGGATHTDPPRTRQGKVLQFPSLSPAEVDEAITA
jgi:hypothetical protein